MDIRTQLRNSQTKKRITTQSLNHLTRSEVMTAIARGASISLFIVAGYIVYRQHTHHNQNATTSVTTACQSTQPNTLAVPTVKPVPLQGVPALPPPNIKK